MKGYKHLEPQRLYILAFLICMSIGLLATVGIISKGFSTANETAAAVVTSRIYLDPVDGNDGNSGEDKSKAVQTFAKAKELSQENGVIYLCNELELEGDIDNKKTITNAEGGQETVELTGLTIMRAPADKNVSSTDTDFTGTMMSVAEGKTVNITNLIIDGGAQWSGTTNDGIKAVAPLISTNGTLKLMGCTLQNNENTASSGGAIVVNAGTCTLGQEYTSYGVENTLINNAATGQTANGGAMYVAGGATGNIYNSVLSNNRATKDGGALYIAEGGTGLISMYLVSGNSATNGGAVYTDGTFTWYGNDSSGHPGGSKAEMKNNTASNFGGGIYIGATGKATLNRNKDDYITGNSAVSGGGVYASEGAELNIDGVEISGNTATENGGGIFLNSATCNIVKNNGDGYRNIIIRGNTVNGASNNVYIGGEVSNPIQIKGEIDTASVIGIANIATAEEPLVVAQSDGTYAVTDADVQKFFVDSDAGMITTEGEGTERKILITASIGTAEEIYLDPQNTTGTASDDNDGKSRAAAVQTFSIAKQKVKANGKIVICSELAVSESINGQNTTDSIITLVRKGKDEDASVAYKGHMMSVTVVNGDVYIRNFIMDGGAVWEGTEDTALGRGTENTGVKATSSLMKTYDDSNSDVYIEDCELRNNDNISESVVDEQGNVTTLAGGGGIAIYKGSLYLSRTVIKDNKAENGGGVFSDSTNDYVIPFIDNTITGNEATKDGGGTYGGSMMGYNNSKTVEISKNKATNGGGVYAKYQFVSAYGGMTITDNTATENGGGVYLSAVALASYVVADPYCPINITGNQKTDGSDNNIYVQDGTTNEAGEPIENGKINTFMAYLVQEDSKIGIANGANSKVPVIATDPEEGMELTAEMLAKISVDNPECTITATGLGTTDAKVYIIEAMDEVYLNPAATESGMGDTAATAVKTFEEAKMMVKPGGTIHVMGQVDLTKDIDGQKEAGTKITLKRYAGEVGDFSDAYKGDLLSVGADPVTISNFIIDGGAVWSTDPGSEGYDATLGRSTTNTGIPAYAGNKGGSLVYNRATVTIDNCVLQNNDNAGFDGGAVLSKEDEGMTITNSTIKNNNADNGGGVDSGGPSFTITGCTVSGNSASSMGGGVLGSHMEMTDCTVTGNTSATYGGGVMAGVSEVRDNTITSSTISGNKAKLGGGVFVYVMAKLNMESGIISDNTAVSGGGVAVYQHGTFNMNDGTISGNQTIEGEPLDEVPSNAGGGVCDMGTANITGGTITGNKSDNGGGVHIVNVHVDGFETDVIGTLKVSGTAKITGNTKLDGTTANNVHNASATTPVQVAGALEDGSAIGIADFTEGDSLLVAKSDGTYPVTASDVKKFSSDADGYMMFGIDATVSGEGSAASKEIYVKLAPDPVGTIYLDPQNTTTTASDTNDGTELSKAVKSFDVAKQLVTADGTIILCSQLDVSVDIDGQKETDKKITLQRYAGVADDHSDAYTGTMLYVASGIQANISNLIVDGGAVWGEPAADNKDEQTLGRSTTNTGITDGGVLLYVANNTNATVTNCDLKNNDALSNIGGGVYINSGSSMEMVGGTISRNSCKFGDGIGYGGGVYARGNFKLNGGTISSNMAGASGNEDSSGGGIYFNGNELTIEDGSTISNNTAYKSGGVHVNSSGTFNMNGGTITGNKAEAGGGVSVNNGIFNMNGGKISGNKAEVGGGGVAANGGTFNMTDGEISANTATGTDVSYDGIYGGGGVLLLYGVTFNMSGGTITGNKAEAGGGVYVMGTSYENNTFTGILKVSGTAKITGNTKLDGTTANNVYYKIGAPVQVSGKLEDGSAIGIANTSITEQLIVKSDGQHAVTEADTLKFSLDTAGYELITKLGVVSETDSTVSRELYMKKTPVEIVYLDPASGDDANDGSSKATAVKTFDMAKQLVTADGTIILCSELDVTADLDGQKESGTKITLKRYAGEVGDFSDAYKGVMLNVSSGVTAEIRNLIVDGGAVWEGEVDAALGRGTTNTGIDDTSYKMVEIFGETTMTNCTLQNNASGGVYVGDGGKFTINNTQIKDNAANLSGIGLEVVAGGTFTMNENSEISGNSEKNGTIATYDGGGVYVAGTFNMNGGTIHHNAVKRGAGVYVQGGIFNMAGGTVSNNTALNGGGVYNNAGTFTMKDASQITGNASQNAGAGVCNEGTFTMENGTISSNISQIYGGGVYNVGTFTMENGTISGNAAANGAGICINNSGFSTTMNGGEISGNIAAQKGGGVYMPIEGISFTMNGGEITGNSASNSAGVYGVSYASLKVKGLVKITGNTITNSSTNSNVNRLQVAGALDNGSEIGVWTTAVFEDTVAKSDGTYAITEADAAKFVPDDSSTYTINTKNLSTTDAEILLKSGASYTVTIPESVSAQDINMSGTFEMTLSEAVSLPENFVLIVTTEMDEITGEGKAIGVDVPLVEGTATTGPQKLSLDIKSRFIYGTSQEYVEAYQAAGHMGYLAENSIEMDKFGDGSMIIAGGPKITIDYNFYVPESETDKTIAPGAQYSTTITFNFEQKLN